MFIYFRIIVVIRPVIARCYLMCYRSTYATVSHMCFDNGIISIQLFSFVFYFMYLKMLF